MSLRPSPFPDRPRRFHADGPGDRSAEDTAAGGRREIRIPLLDEEMVEIYRGWTPLAASDDMMRFTRSLLHGVLREEHPDWTEEEIQREIARRILGSPLPDEVPGDDVGQP